MIACLPITASHEEINEIFASAGLKDGETNFSKANPKDTFHWYLQVKSKEGSEASKYIVWELLVNEPIVVSDDKILSRKLTYELHFYSRLPIINHEVSDVLEKVNQAFVNKGWSFEMEVAPDYDPELKMYDYAFDVEKVYHD